LSGKKELLNNPTKIQAVRVGGSELPGEPQKNSVVTTAVEKAVNWTLSRKRIHIEPVRAKLLN
jgi:hypothetical protein